MITVAPKGINHITQCQTQTPLEHKIVLVLSLQNLDLLCYANANQVYMKC